MNEESEDTPDQVVVTDVQIPFVSLVILMIKIAVAAIPATIILIILGAALSGFLRGLAGGY